MDHIGPKEVKIAEGIYVTDYRKKKPQASSTNSQDGNWAIQSDANAADRVLITQYGFKIPLNSEGVLHPMILDVEIARVENSTEKLHYSNQEMIKFVDEAIEKGGQEEEIREFKDYMIENMAIIQKQLFQAEKLKEIKAKIEEGCAVHKLMTELRGTGSESVKSTAQALNEPVLLQSTEGEEETANEKTEAEAKTTTTTSKTAGDEGVYL
mmetsp:Transcript_59260/g.67457  ORF Transcript_59260/g.67457 Transcript_59260/m.67457 type:complete len:210 (-) Transcript_59260:99-728(-)